MRVTCTPLQVVPLALFALLVPTARGVPAAGGGPVIDSVVPHVVASVVDGGQTVQLAGSGFVGVTDVLVDGVPLVSFPPTYSIVSPSLIELQMPQVSKLGAVEIVVQTSAGDSPPATILVRAPSTPELLLVGDGGILITAAGATLTIGGLPGDPSYIFASISDVPSFAPGILGLDIGNDFLEIVLVARRLMPDKGWLDLNFPLGPSYIGAELYFQGAQFPGGQIPGKVSPVRSGLVIF